MTLRDPPVGTECRECGNPAGAHNLGCKIGHLEAIAEVEKLRVALRRVKDFPYAGTAASVQIGLIAGEALGCDQSLASTPALCGTGNPEAGDYAGLVAKITGGTQG